MQNLLEIGKIVTKKSNKPFKSGQKTATIKGYKKHTHTGKPSYLFEEDDSEVEAFRCIEYKH